MLSFDKPKKALPTDVHNSYNSSDSGIDGTYMPNMSTDDMQKWKAKRFNANKMGDRIEIRKTMGGTQLLIIVAVDGWNYKFETVEKDPTKQWGNHSTKGLNVRISANGPLLMTFEQFDEINAAVSEAKTILGV